MRVIIFKLKLKSCDNEPAFATGTAIVIAATKKQALTMIAWHEVSLKKELVDTPDPTTDEWKVVEAIPLPKLYSLSTPRIVRYSYFTATGKEGI